MMALAGRGAVPEALCCRTTPRAPCTRIKIFGALILRNRRGIDWVSFHFETGGNKNSAHSKGLGAGANAALWRRGMGAITCLVA